MLYLAPQIPFPAIDGGKISIFYPAKYLSDYFKIFMFAPTGAASSASIAAAVEEFKKRNITFDVYKKDTRDSLLNVLLSIFSILPFKWRKYYSSTFMEYLEKFVIKESINIVWVSSPHMAVYAKKLKEKFPNLIIYLREHNIESDLVFQYKKFTKNILHKVIAGWQLRKTLRCEIDYWDCFDLIFFISDYDYKRAMEISSNLVHKRFALYDGYEVGQSTTSVSDDSILFAGNLEVPQNYYNMLQFIKNIWIPNRLNLNGRKLIVAGNKNNILSRIIFELRSGSADELGIIDIGFVEDIDREILKHKFFLSPTIFGSGLRLKMLHAMSLGRVVICTKYDSETISVFKNGENICSYDDAAEFASCFLSLDDTRANEISFAARATVLKHFDWRFYSKNIYDHSKKFLPI